MMRPVVLVIKYFLVLIVKVTNLNKLNNNSFNKNNKHSQNHLNAQFVIKILTVKETILY